MGIKTTTTYYKNARAYQAAQNKTQSTERSVVPLAFEKVKQEWISYFNAVNERLAKIKKQWNQYETDARSEYNFWYHSVFAKDLSEVREVTDELHELKNTYDAIRAQININSRTPKTAYEYVLNAIKNKQDPMPTDAEFSLFKKRKSDEFYEVFENEFGFGGRIKIDRDLLDEIRSDVHRETGMRFHEPRNEYEARQIHAWVNSEITRRYHEEMRKRAPESLKPVKNKTRDQNKSTKIDFDYNQDPLLERDDDQGIRDELNKLFSGMAEEMGMDPDDIKKLGEELLGIKENGHQGANSTLTDYKSLYRQVVRLLHPDRGHEMSVVEKELWQEAQTAYRRQDIETLRIVLLRIEGGGTINIESLTSIGAIRDIVIQLNYEYDETNYLKSREKKEHVYRFWASKRRPKNREKLELQIRNELRQQMHFIKHQARGLKSELQSIKKSRVASKPSF